MKNYRLYLVGGYVRDKLLGVESNDVDYSFEFSESFFQNAPSREPQWFFEEMNGMLEAEGFTIHTTFPDCFTTKARFPKGHINEKLSVDIVMCRKESYRDSNSRKPMVEAGTLYDDLLRRDFTVNAMAIDDTGVLIDPFDGASDLKKKLIRCPVSASQSFNDDPLRMLRALRFGITKGFTLESSIQHVIMTDEVMWDKFAKVVSTERIREELVKMLTHSTVETMRLLVDIGDQSRINIVKFLLRDEIWFKPTTEKR